MFFIYCPIHNRSRLDLDRKITYEDAPISLFFCPDCNCFYTPIKDKDLSKAYKKLDIKVNGKNVYYTLNQVQIIFY